MGSSGTGDSQHVNSLDAVARAPYHSKLRYGKGFKGLPDQKGGKIRDNGQISCLATYIRI